MALTRIPEGRPATSLVSLASAHRAYEHGHGQRFVRFAPDSLDDLAVAGTGSRSSQESRRLAAQMEIVVGSRSSAVETFLDALASVPADHLRVLRQRGVAIIFAPTVPLGFGSSAATTRRGHGLSIAEMQDIEAQYGEQTGVAAVFDPATDSLILPTGYLLTHDVEWLVLHEIGHALTLDAASLAEQWLKQSRFGTLPRRIVRHLSRRGYERGNRSAEILAEAYALVVVGRQDELPFQLLSDLLGILAFDGSISAGEEPTAIQGRSCLRPVGGLCQRRPNPPTWRPEGKRLPPRTRRGA